MDLRYFLYKMIWGNGNRLDNISILQTQGSELERHYRRNLIIFHSHAYLQHVHLLRGSFSDNLNMKG